MAFKRFLNSKFTCKSNKVQFAAKPSIQISNPVNKRKLRKPLNFYEWDEWVWSSNSVSLKSKITRPGKSHNEVIPPLICHNTRKDRYNTDCLSSGRTGCDGSNMTPMKIKWNKVERLSTFSATSPCRHFHFSHLKGKEMHNPRLRWTISFEFFSHLICGCKIFYIDKNSWSATK